MSQWRMGWRKKRGPSDCKCKHPQVIHYTKDGHCVFPGCFCDGYKAAGKKEFQNKRARCAFNHHHDSGLEIKVCSDLHHLQLAGEIKSYQSQAETPLLGPSGSVIASYKVDFIVEHNDGTIEFIEAKGTHLIRLQPWPLKWALLRDKHKGDPMFKFRVIEG